MGKEEEKIEKKGIIIFPNGSMKMKWRDMSTHRMIYSNRFYAIGMEGEKKIMDIIPNVSQQSNWSKRFVEHLTAQRNCKEIFIVQQLTADYSTIVRECLVYHTAFPQFSFKAFNIILNYFSLIFHDTLTSSHYKAIHPFSCRFNGTLQSPFILLPSNWNRYLSNISFVQFTHSIQ